MLYGMSELSSAYWQNFEKTREGLRKKITQDQWRLKYHLMPETGWMNDPNGLVQFNGTYHIYHQYVPDDPKGGLVHWGHKTSDDLVHFKEEDLFLSPDRVFDKSGVYSGSAFVKDDEIHFFYTGNVKHPGDHEYTFSGREQNTVHVVSKDGFTVDYREVCIPHEDYPQGFTNHIRDPKVFEKNGKYYMILGARALNNRGKILIYTSKDLYNWVYSGIFLEGKKEMGYMWECPDFFETPQKDVLLFSPQGLKATEYSYSNTHQTGYYLGKVDWNKGGFIPDTPFEELDKGFDFYAPQTFEDESGRRILFAWMGLGDTDPEYSNPTVPRGWQHALTLPRELTVVNGKLKQSPLIEYQKLRTNKVTANIDLKETFELKAENQDTFELLVEVEKLNSSFTIHIKEDTTLTYKNNLFTLKHGVSGYGRSSRSVEIETLDKVHLFGDTSSIEIFLNDGEYVLTSRVYPKKLRQSILFEGNGSLGVTFWNLEL